MLFSTKIVIQSENVQSNEERVIQHENVLSNAILE